MSLNGKQKSYLRSEAHHLQPIFQIGKGGLNDMAIVQIGEALEKRELIKISFLQNTSEDPKEVAVILEDQLECTVIQKIGKVLVLYRPAKKEKNRHYSLEVKKLVSPKE